MEFKENSWLRFLIIHKYHKYRVSRHVNLNIIIYFQIGEEEPLLPKFVPLQTEDPENASELSDLDSIADEMKEPWRYYVVKWSLYIIIWVTLYVFFINVGFGAVFFVVSTLVFICINTRTGRKKPGEPSAYSVFNEDCQSIDGTLKAEELQRQMMLGMGGLRLF